MRRIKCPECNGNASVFHDTDGTYIHCQRTTCNAFGQRVFKTHRASHPSYPEIIMVIPKLDFQEIVQCPTFRN